MAKITFLVDTTIEICVGFDEQEDVIMIEEDIKEGEVYEGDIEDANSEDVWGVQFGDGDYAFIAKKIINVEN